MELGVRIPQGGSILQGQVGGICFAIGLVGAERVALQMPAAAIPGALERVRRLNTLWPRFPVILEEERVSNLASLTESLQSLPMDTLRFCWQQTEYEDSHWERAKDTVRLWLSPKTKPLQDIDRYYRQEIREHKKPIRWRKPIPAPDDFVSQSLDLGTVTPFEHVWWQLETELSLLEVALAVRMYRVEHGWYPARLSSISRRWLPAVPRDPWGQTIAYRLRNGSPLIYSFGPDGRDDGGQPADPLRLTASTRGDLVWGSLTRRRH